jgi:TP901-1 family phage major tail protein
MAKILGVDVLVSIGGNVIGSQRDCSLSISGKEIDVSDKTTGGWDTFLVGNRSWEISCDAIALDSDAAKAAIETAVANGTQVTVEFDHSTGSVYSGSAVVTSFQLTGPKDDVSTMSCTLKGASALTIA